MRGVAKGDERGVIGGKGSSCNGFMGAHVESYSNEPVESMVFYEFTPLTAAAACCDATNRCHNTHAI